MDERMLCPECHGLGRVPSIIHDESGLRAITDKDCPTCLGLGWVWGELKKK